MTDYTTTWDKILRSLSVDDKCDPVCKVKTSATTEHLDILYTKIAELEQKWEKFND